ILIRGVQYSPTDLERKIFEKLLNKSDGKRVLAALVAEKLDQLSSKTSPRVRRERERAAEGEGGEERAERPRHEDRGERRFDRERGERPRFGDREERGERRFDRDRERPRFGDREERGERRFDRERGERRFDRDR